MTPDRRGRRHTDPVATMTLFRDPGVGVHPTADEVRTALHAIYPEEAFNVEHRAMVVDGTSHVVFEVYARATTATGPPEERRASEARWPF